MISTNKAFKQKLWDAAVAITLDTSLFWCAGYIFVSKFNIPIDWNFTCAIAMTAFKIALK